MLSFLKKIFAAKPAQTTAVAEAPYKLEAPEPMVQPVNAQPYVVTNSDPADNIPVVKKQPAKKRSADGESAKTAKTKAPAKKKPAAKK